MFPVGIYARNGSDDLNGSEDESEVELHDNPILLDSSLVAPQMRNDSVFREKRDALKTEFKNTRDAAKDEEKTILEDMKGERSGLIGDARKSLEDAIKARRENLQAEIAAKKEQLKKDLVEIKKDKVTARKTFVENRFSAVIKVFGAHQTRIAGKIDELTAKGYDMTDATVALDASKKSLASASDLLAKLTSTTVSDTSESSAVKPREIAKNIETVLKEAKTHLIEAVTAIKKAIVEKDGAPEDTDTE